MLMDCSENEEVADVLLRLLVNFTNPALLLYREELPKDNVGRRNFLELVEILQRYKESFSKDALWVLFGKRLEKTLEIVSVSSRICKDLLKDFFILYFYQGLVGTHRGSRFTN